MAKRNTLVLIVLLIIFVLALFVVFPIEKGILGKKGIRLGLDLQGGTRIVYQADLSSIEAGGEGSALDGVVAVLENRINPLGITEPIVQKLQGGRIAVELPGKNISDKEKESLSRVVLLEFGELVTDNETAKWENKLGRWKPATGVIDGQVKELTSQYFNENTYLDQDELGRLVIKFEWDKEGSQLSEQITSRLIDKPLGIFEGNEALIGEDGQPIAPTVRSTITNRGQIEGLSAKDATRLSKQLNAGRLPVPLQKESEQTVSPILGSNFVEMSVTGGLIAIGLVMLFIIIYYRISGLMASLALVYYGVILLALFKLLGVTLSLAGIGGFILSIGMAIDANVLIFERMKEELWTGRSLGAAIEAGFRRAWTAIWDSNITTILAGIILYLLGSSSVVSSTPLKGFALTLMIGVAISMFTAIMVTRTFLRLFVGGGLAQKSWLFAPYQSKERENV